MYTRKQSMAVTISIALSVTFPLERMGSEILSQTISNALTVMISHADNVASQSVMESVASVKTVMKKDGDMPLLLMKHLGDTEGKTKQQRDEIYYKGYFDERPAYLDAMLWGMIEYTKGREVQDDMAYEFWELFQMGQNIDIPKAQDLVGRANKKNLRLMIVEYTEGSFDSVYEAFIEVMDSDGDAFRAFPGCETENDAGFIGQWDLP